MTARCAVIGNPIAHSQSPEIHADFAQQRGIALQYDRILAEPETFTAIVKQFFADGGRGLNITVPFKENAFALCQRRTAYAEKAGAVNTLWIQDGALWGDNTDGRGLVHALQTVHHTPLAAKRILLLGAGGAARGVLLPLLESQPACLHISNRTHDKAISLIQAIAPNTAAVQAIAHPTEPYDLIINATSAGLQDTTFSLAPASVLTPQTVCYDMVYGKTTPFMQWAQTHGATAYDGRSMLEAQAWLSFCIWFGNA